MDLYVDMYATSRALDNPSYMMELTYMIEHCGLTYDVIHINNGLHGFHQAIEIYVELYEKVLSYLISTSPQSRIIAALSTPVTIANSRGEYDEKNRIVKERNDAVVKLCEKYSLEINNLYRAVDGLTEIRNSDGFHYSVKGYRYLAKAVCDVL